MRLKLCNAVSKVMCFCSRNRYYVNSKVGEVMKKEFNFETDIKQLRNSVEILEELKSIIYDDDLLDTLLKAKVSLKCLIYDLEDCVSCD